MSLHEEILRGRRMLGPRGTVLKAADADPRREGLVSELLKALASQTDSSRNEIAPVLGEIGGEDVAAFLADALRSELSARNVDEDYQVYLASALANIGGPDAVEQLLSAAERGSKRVRLVALSGLESLATAGSAALTEYPEPATIESPEMHEAYLRLAERLRALISASDTPSYVRYKAGELLDTILISLSSVQFAF
jgi:HEAT repeat protein